MTYSTVGTTRDNTLDMINKDRNHPLRGSDCPVSKLTEAQVAIIKETPKTSKALAKEYGVSRATIDLIKTNKTWRHVEADVQRPEMPKGAAIWNAKLSDADVLAIRASGLPTSTLMVMYDVKATTISSILTGISWKHLDTTTVRKNNFRRGENSPKAKLTADQVRAIRLDQRRNATIAREYGVSGPTINGIKSRKYWAHVV